jgi:hypothetical protein
MVLMLVMVPEAIEGSTNTKADHPKHVESTPAIESQPLMKSLGSLEVGGATILGVAL